MSVRPTLVIGSPRSGTTLIGVCLGSAPGVADLGEYVGYDFCYRLAVAEMAAMPAVGMAEYLAELQQHALDFPRRLAVQRSANWFVASAPWNLLVAQQVAAAEPEALFVLCIRDVRGVCQSLARSYANGRTWVGADTSARVGLWRRFYAVAPQLPPTRTIVLDYDRLCADPEPVFYTLLADLVRLGFPADGIDLARLTESYANHHRPQPTIARRTRDGTLVWQRRMGWDPTCWSASDAAVLAADPHFPAVEADLRRFVSALRTTTSAEAI
jgi:hypothetical protein